MINLLRTLIFKIEQHARTDCNVSKEFDILRKDQKEMLEIKNIVTDMKNAFDELTSTLDIVKERIVSLKISQQRLCKLKCKEEKKDEKNQNRISKNWDNNQRCSIRIMNGNMKERSRSI